MGNWIVAAVLLLIWLVQVLRGKGGFIHILLLCSFSVALVQWVANHRARQEKRMRDETGK